MTDETPPVAATPKKRGPYKPRAIQPIDRIAPAVQYGDDSRAATELLEKKLRPQTRKPLVRVDGAIDATDRDSRIRYCAELIATGRWRIAHTRELANVWGISTYRVSSIVTEAHRQVRDAVGDRERVRMNVLTFLEGAAHDALAEGDRRSAVAAMRAIADIAGLVTSRVEHTGADGQPIAVALQAVRSLTNEELEAEILRAGAARAQRVAAIEVRELTPTEAALVSEAKQLGAGEPPKDETPAP